MNLTYLNYRSYIFMYLSNFQRVVD